MGNQSCIHQSNQCRRLLKATAVILPLLGITWALGLLAVNADDGTLVFAYLFTIFNSLQVSKYWALSYILKGGITQK